MKIGKIVPSERSYVSDTTHVRRFCLYNDKRFKEKKTPMYMTKVRGDFRSVLNCSSPGGVVGSFVRVCGNFRGVPSPSKNLRLEVDVLWQGVYKVYAHVETRKHIRERWWCHKKEEDTDRLKMSRKFVVTGTPWNGRVEDQTVVQGKEEYMT